eukprot:TRINITY_DN12503_c0_g1_i2.p1 TRINITY_DN12503_c0_g1~~TRINITY_DN12503_c0_g1_i2.p1  ORF type:complete len:139 (+),score=21.83 TRINITY_DN12503_c0_g1_i2:85-501(+)
MTPQARRDAQVARADEDFFNLEKNLTCLQALERFAIHAQRRGDNFLHEKKFADLRYAPQESKPSASTSSTFFGQDSPLREPAGVPRPTGQLADSLQRLAKQLSEEVEVCGRLQGGMLLEGLRQQADSLARERREPPHA